ncbi:MAG: CocE/NonD family hydrolase [Clostridiales bacterium]|nr:CocE/NonD family hydrolase [Clostridiales bacterium]
MNNYYEAFVPHGDLKISRPGEYQGYTAPMYDGFRFFSCYVTMHDGVKIAVTYYRPTCNNKLVETPLPVIWRMTPYGRILYNEKGEIHHTAFFTGDGAGMGPCPRVPDDYAGDDASSGVKMGSNLMIKIFTSYGYIIAQADVRGKFASFGFRRSANTDPEAGDGYEINEWLASQPWCDGNVGMFGSSYTGQTQLETLRKNPPHLKAAVICMTDFNKFDGWNMGGIARGGDMDMCPPDNPAVIVPVDEDTDKTMLCQALEQHKLNRQDIPVDEGNPTVLSGYRFPRLPYRDSFSDVTGTRFWIDESASTHLEEINRSDTAVYLIGGWYDVFRRDTVVMYHNLTLPKKMIIGPWYHTRYKKELNLLIEHMRFYDYWLKGIDNGIMDEPPIYVKTIHGETGGRSSWEDGWQFLSQWPPSGYHNISLFLGSGKLEENACSRTGDHDQYRSDYTIRDWEEQDYAEDIVKKGLVYTGEMLENDCNVTGHPIVDLYFTSSGKNGDFFTFLLDLDEGGNSHIVSFGRLRASARLTKKAPYDTMGLPWHPCYENDTKMPSFEYGPVRLSIDMKPVSYIFQRGHRIQLAVTTSMSRFQFYREEPEPIVTIHRDALYPSRITLPVKEE